MGEENTFVDPILDNPEWINVLPDDIREEASLAVIKDFPGLVKGYVHGQKMVGADKIALPGKDAGDDTWNEFYGKLGRPETAADYGLKKPEDLPEGFPYSEDIEKGFSEQAHKLGLTPKQVKGLFSWYMSGEAETLTTMQADKKLALAKTEAELKKEFGSAYTESLAGARLLVDKFGGSGFKEHLDTSGLGDDLMLTGFLARLSRQFAEDTLKGDGTKLFHTMAPAEAIQEIKRLRMDKEFMNIYMDKRLPGHSESVEKYQTLYKLAYPKPEEKK